MNTLKRIRRMREYKERVLHDFRLGGNRFQYQEAEADIEALKEAEEALELQERLKDDGR